MAKKKSAKKKSSTSSGSKKKSSRKKSVAGRMGDMMESAGKGIASAARATGRALGVSGTRRKKSAKKKK
jgi:hypothetical protein